MALEGDVPAFLAADTMYPSVRFDHQKEIVVTSDLYQGTPWSRPIGAIQPAQTHLLTHLTPSNGRTVPS